MQPDDDKLIPSRLDQAVQDEIERHHQQLSEAFACGMLTGILVTALLFGAFNFLRI